MTDIICNMFDFIIWIWVFGKLFAWKDYSFFSFQGERDFFEKVENAI